jgi:hypothetical protein
LIAAPQGSMFVATLDEYEVNVASACLGLSMSHWQWNVHSSKEEIFLPFKPFSAEHAPKASHVSRL